MNLSVKTVADLHLHSLASDGELEPEALVDLAADAGLAAMALTDHDSMDGVARAIAQGEKRGVEVIAGCELSAYLGTAELHILGLFVNQSEGSSLARLLSQVRAERPKRLLAMAEKIRKLGFSLTDEEVLKESAQSRSPGRAHLGAVLVKRRMAKDMADAFIRFLRPGAPGYIAKRQLDPKDAINAIHASGGLAILAHPAQYAGRAPIETFFALGLDGLEVHHHSHSPTDVKKYTELALAHGKLLSGGSDYHGPRMKPGITVGSNGVSAEMLAALKSAATARAR